MTNNSPPTRYEIHAATPRWAFIFTQAANALLKELNPHDMHCDIQPEVAHVMGFYEGAAVLDEESALGILLEDLAIITSLLNKDPSVYPQKGDAAGVLGEWKNADDTVGVQISIDNVSIEFVPSIHKILIGYNEERGRVLFTLEHTPIKEEE